MWHLIVAIFLLLILLVIFLRNDHRQTALIRALETQVFRLELELPEHKVLADIERMMTCSRAFQIPMDDKTLVLRFGTLSATLDFLAWMDRQRVKARRSVELAG